MFRKIIRRKTRNGIIAFFAGLGIILGSLYIDAIRGNPSGTIGIYQVVGALTGYILSGIGGVLVMKDAHLRRTVQDILLYGGGVIVAISILADHIGIAGKPGFDKFQIVGIIIGLVILTAGVSMIPKRFTQKIAKQK